jgi:galactokinase
MSEYRVTDSTVAAAFRERFGSAPTMISRAPGRVNLIGDHTDYNDGFVLPMAIDRAVWIAWRPRDDERVVAYSLDRTGSAAFSIATDDGPIARTEDWAEYVRGVAWALRADGRTLRGWEGVIASDVPIGAGLSSSAALELATARTFVAASNDTWDARAMARLAQRAENEWVGVSCGIMDQLVSASGVRGHALFIDCRSLETRAVRLPDNVAVIVLDTATRRELSSSAYNERRAECDAAARALGVATLRDVSLDRLEAEASRLSPIVARRARHVVTENARTLAVAEALAVNDLERVGAAMRESHASLRADFEVSTPALDAMVAIAARDAGCVGARMTGAGFGGCAVALVRRDAVASFTRNVATAYELETHRTPALYVCDAADGASCARA